MSGNLIVLQLIRACLSQLEPTNCNIMLSSKKYNKSDIEFQTEKWFGTKYLVEGMLRSYSKLFSGSLLSF